MKKVAVSEYQLEKVRKAMKESGLDPDGLSDSDVVDQAMTVAAFYFAGDEEEE
jgi:hypothetical protein